MSLTEEETRSKQCHQSGYPFDKHPKQRCIASECMAWRWMMVNQCSGGASLEIGGEVVFPNAVAKAFTKEPPSTARGYCGLAGSP